MTRIAARAAWLALLGALFAPPVELAAQGDDRAFVNPRGEIRFHIAAGSDAELGYRHDDPELARWALAAWQRAGAGAFTFTAVDDAGDAQIRVVLGGARGLYGIASPDRTAAGTAAVTVVVNTATEAQSVAIAERARADRLYRDTIVYLTCVHEIGHALGLVHTSNFADVMYYFGYGGDIPEFFGRYRALLANRSDIARFSGVSADDIAQLLRTDSSIAPNERGAR